ncbi:hypothetical protein B0H15DRAFT_956503 [Mycena belliarum]|uniref:Uncharacterized protein n=1 Tax=Mycena belliarum TaxID=1033014 RepID=A0AAD6TPI8_9AGAR|nr:hypothetical protein B0H15DRAFT_956503 [Mycena belliae]
MPATLSPPSWASGPSTTWLSHSSLLAHLGRDSCKGGLGTGASLAAKAFAILICATRHRACSVALPVRDSERGLSAHIHALFAPLSAESSLTCGWLSAGLCALALGMDHSVPGHSAHLASTRSLSAFLPPRLAIAAADSTPRLAAFADARSPRFRRIKPTPTVSDSHPTAASFTAGHCAFCGALRTHRYGYPLTPSSSDRRPQRALVPRSFPLCPEVLLLAAGAPRFTISVSRLVLKIAIAILCLGTSTFNLRFESAAGLASDELCSMASLNRQSATRIDFKRGMTLAPRVAFEIKPATRFEPRIDFIPQLHSPSDPRRRLRVVDFESKGLRIASPALVTRPVLPSNSSTVHSKPGARSAAPPGSRIDSERVVDFNLKTDALLAASPTSTANSTSNSTSDARRYFDPERIACAHSNPKCALAKNTTGASSPLSLAASDLTRAPPSLEQAAPTEHRYVLGTITRPSRSLDITAHTARFLDVTRRKLRGDGTRARGESDWIGVRGPGIGDRGLGIGEWGSGNGAAQRSNARADPRPDERRWW